MWSKLYVQHIIFVAGYLNLQFSFTLFKKTGWLLVIASSQAKDKDKSAHYLNLQRYFFCLVEWSFFFFIKTFANLIKTWIPEGVFIQTESCVLYASLMWFCNHLQFRPFILTCNSFLLVFYETFVYLIFQWSKRRILEFAKVKRQIISFRWDFIIWV